MSVLQIEKEELYQFLSHIVGSSVTGAKRVQAALRDIACPDL
jgi:hypothetical protein